MNFYILLLYYQFFLSNFTIFFKLKTLKIIYLIKIELVILASYNLGKLLAQISNYIKIIYSIINYIINKLYKF